MYKPKTKPKSSSSLRRLIGKVLRLLRADLEFQASSNNQKIIAQEAALVDICHVSQKEIGSALLNAERKKAEGLMERQRHPQLY